MCGWVTEVGGGNSACKRLETLATHSCCHRDMQPCRYLHWGSAAWLCCHECSRARASSWVQGEIYPTEIHVACLYPATAPHLKENWNFGPIPTTNTYVSSNSAACIRSQASCCCDPPRWSRFRQQPLRHDDAVVQVIGKRRMRRHGMVEIGHPPMPSCGAPALCNTFAATCLALVCHRRAAENKK